MLIAGSQSLKDGWKSEFRAERLKGDHQPQRVHLSTPLSIFYSVSALVASSLNFYK